VAAGQRADRRFRRLGDLPDRDHYPGACQAVGAVQVAADRDSKEKRRPMIQCIQCKRPFPAEDRIASMSGSVMGCECTDVYSLCPLPD